MLHRLNHAKKHPYTLLYYTCTYIIIEKRSHCCFYSALDPRRNEQWPWGIGAAAMLFVPGRVSVLAHHSFHRPT